MAILIYRFTERAKLFLRTSYERMSNSEMGLVLNKTPLQIQQKLTNMNLVRTMSGTSLTQVATRFLFKKWEIEQDELLVEIPHETLPLLIEKIKNEKKDREDKSELF